MGQYQSNEHTGKVWLILPHMGNTSLTDVVTWGSVCLILPHTSQFDSYCHLRVSLIDIATKESVWEILLHTD